MKNDRKILMRGQESDALSIFKVTCGGGVEPARSLTPSLKAEGATTSAPALQLGKPMR